MTPTTGGIVNKECKTGKQKWPPKRLGLAGIEDVLQVPRDSTQAITRRSKYNPAMLNQWLGIKMI